MTRVPAAAGLAMLAAWMSLPAVNAAQRPGGACAALASLALPDTTIASAAEVSGPALTLPGAAAGSSALRDLPAFCRVTAVTKPAVKFEVWLPLANWNGKFQGVGNGANAGSIGYGAMATALRRGYATASTDTGHATTNARDAAWAVGHPELMHDFGHRAIHVMTDNAKQIVAAFYRRPAQHAYFVGCSTGGRQALMEAQRYPDDYDGIIAGAPAANWTRFQTGGHLWIALALNKDPESYIPADKLRTIGDAVNRACDGLDGITDGILNDPRRCAFDPSTLVCKSGQDPGSCLTAKQAKAVKDIWAGSRDRSGKVIYPGYMPGAEAAGGWANYMSGTGPLSGNHWEQAENVLKYMVFENPNWDFRTFDFERDLPFAEKKLAHMLDAFDPDLSRFQQRGGKLLLYHGWNDPSISPLNTIDYYERVVATLQRGRSRQEAESAAGEFVRLFMAPGMLHCSGGPGPSSFDMLGVLEGWVERREAPARVIATGPAGTGTRSRPLCPYPQVAVHTGRGSTDEAANFVCQAPAGTR